MREGDFPNQRIEGIRRLEPTSLDVGVVIENVSASRLFFIASLRHLGDGIGRHLILLGEDSALAYEFLRNGVFQQCAILRHDVAKYVADLLVYLGQSCHKVYLPQMNTDEHRLGDSCPCVSHGHRMDWLREWLAIMFHHLCSSVFICGQSPVLS